MGRRKSRKRQRSRERRDRLNADVPRTDTALLDRWEALLSHASPADEFVPRTCGRCREFIEDGEFGRGSCLHPASGVFSPWNDTPACSFFHRA